VFGLSIHALQQVRQEQEQGLELAPVLVLGLGLELAQVLVLEPALGLEPVQGQVLVLEPVRVLHKQRLLN